jgi:hypothetical protein
VLGDAVETTHARGGQITRPNRTVRNPTPEALMFGSSLADVFTTPACDCRTLTSDQEPEFAVTRLRSGPRDMEKAPEYPPDQAILVCVSLTPASIGQSAGHV